MVHCSREPFAHRLAQTLGEGCICSGCLVRNGHEFIERLGMNEPGKSHLKIAVRVWLIHRSRAIILEDKSGASKRHLGLVPIKGRKSSYSGSYCGRIFLLTQRRWVAAGAAERMLVGHPVPRAMAESRERCDGGGFSEAYSANLSEMRLKSPCGSVSEATEFRARPMGMSASFTSIKPF